jgi:hypothetical protein
VHSSLQQNSSKPETTLSKADNYESDTAAFPAPRNYSAAIQNEPSYNERYDSFANKHNQASSNSSDIVRPSQQTNAVRRGINPPEGLKTSPERSRSGSKDKYYDDKILESSVEQLDVIKLSPRNSFNQEPHYGSSEKFELDNNLARDSVDSFVGRNRGNDSRNARGQSQERGSNSSPKIQNRQESP